MSDKVIFYTSDYCPFAQRTWLVLLEKKIDFEHVEIALRDENKQLYGERKREVYPWLYEMNPAGTVPVIKHGDNVLYESLVICEYLDEAFTTGTKMMPSDPYRRGLVRLMINHIAGIVPLMYQSMSKTIEKEQQEVNDTLIKKLDFLNSEMIRVGQDGPYMLGSEITLADAAFIGFFC